MSGARSAAAGNTVVLLQVSDTHLFANRGDRLRGVDTYDACRRVLKDASARYPGADACLLSGDLSQDGSAESYRNLKRLIGEPRVPFFATPGNHDDRQGMALGLLSPDIRLDAYTDLGAWRVVFVDTQTPGEEYGSINPQEMDRLARSLSTGGRHHLFCMHHPPIPLGSEWLDRSRLRDDEAFFGMLAGTAGAKAAVWGHAHQEYFEVRGDWTLMGVPSTCTQFKPKSFTFEQDDAAPGYRVIRLYDDGSVDTEVVRVEAEAQGGQTGVVEP